ncbi:hypothetical protein Pfo_024548 [Paulownia fortunei]|nr:hypothetical protein Pfo_024548 [Paulownia fortunei]
MPRMLRLLIHCKIVNMYRVSDGDDDGPSHPVFNPVMVFVPTFEIGMIFGTKNEFRKVVQSYAIRTKRTLKFIKNDKIRVYVRCSGEEYEWKINALKMKNECNFQIREYNPNHSCLPTRPDHGLDLKRNEKGFRVDVINDIRYHVSRHQAYRTKRKALSMIEGNPDIQYSKLWDYEQNGGERFNKFYICFDALKKGFLSGCRPMIRKDGCHLKSPHGGVLLTTVGVDPNNNLFLIRYTIVCKEYRDTWEWFLTVIKNDWNIARHHEYTFIFYVRHLHNNFKNAGFRGLAFKNALWRAGQASTPGEFKLRMKEIRDLNESAWSRSHFSEGPKCDMLLNNVCQTFNSNTVDAREKSIITMLEWIRKYLMKRLQENRDKAEAKWKGKLCPKIKKIIEKHVMWGLSGIPCKHVLSAILNQNELLEDYMHSCYSVEIYKKVYAPAIMGISCEQLWGETLFIPPLPPNLGRGVGKPSRARRRESDEPNDKKKKTRGKQTLKMKRQQTNVKCRLCGIARHNAVTCLGKNNAPTKSVAGVTISEEKTNAPKKFAVGATDRGENVRKDVPNKSAAGSRSGKIVKLPMPAINHNIPKLRLQANLSLYLH